VPEYQKTKNDGLDQYGPERFGRLVFATVRKNVEMNGLKQPGSIFWLDCMNGA